MPLDFLNDDQVAVYERFGDELTRAELEGFFLLDGTALDLIANKRGDHNRLGLAVQIGTVRCLGHFLTEDSLAVPWPAVEYVASQLGVADPSAIKRYTDRVPTAYEHSWEIRDAFGYRDFHAEQVVGAFGEFLAARAWTHAEGALALFRQAVAWLRRERVLLPGVSSVTRLVVAAREDANQRMYRTLAEAAGGVDVELPWLLLDLLEVPEGRRVSRLEELRKLERRDSGPGMERALDRVEKALALRARSAQLQAVPRQPAGGAGEVWHGQQGAAAQGAGGASAHRDAADDRPASGGGRGR